MPDKERRLYGTPFDPKRIALVEEPLKFKISDPDPNGTVRVVRMTNTLIELQSSSQTPAFLVMSDVYYPGCKATVNGAETRIFQTNYVLRGILLPPGRNTIRLDFRPLTVYVGAIISGLTLAGLLVLCFGDKILNSRSVRAIRRKQRN